MSSSSSSKNACCLNFFPINILHYVWYFLSACHKGFAALNFAAMKYYETEEEEEGEPLVEICEGEDDGIDIDIFTKKEKLQIMQREYEKQKNKLIALKLCENIMEVDNEADEVLYNLLLDEHYDTHLLCLSLQRSIHAEFYRSEDDEESKEEEDSKED